MTETQKKRGRPKCFKEDDALEAALRVFLKRGFEGSSLDDLTKELGINRPSLYSTFGNKEDLFITALRKYHKKYQTHFAALLEKDLPPKEMIREWLFGFINNYQTQEIPVGCLIVNSTILASENHPRIAEEIKSFHELNEKLLTDYFESEKQKGRFSGNAAKTSQFYNAIVQGMAVLHRNQCNQSVLENIASTAMDAYPE